METKNPTPPTEMSGVLKRLRLRRGLGQAEAAGLIGVAPSEISRYEAGVREPSLRKLWVLETMVYQVPPGTVLREVGYVAEEPVGVRAAIEAATDIPPAAARALIAAYETHAQEHEREIAARMAAEEGTDGTLD